MQIVRELPPSTCYPEIKSGKKTLGKARLTWRAFRFAGKLVMSRSERQSEARRISDARKSGREIVLAAYDEIVEKLVEQARSASVPHAKLCFELLETARDKGKDTEEESEDHPNLVEYLIEQLQLTPPADCDGAQAETV